MKKAGILYIAPLLIAGLLLSNRSLAQDPAEWHFTEGAKMRLGKGRIIDIKFSPDGSRFAVATTIGIWIYDAHTGEELSLLAVLPGEGRMVTTIAFSPDGRTLASGESGGAGRLWDVLTGEPIATFKEVSGRRFAALKTLVFSVDGMKLMGATTKEIGIWKLGVDIKRLTTSQLEKANTVMPITSVLISPDRRFLAAQLMDWKNKNFQIQLWDTATGKLSHTLTGHTQRITSIAFSADSKTLMSGDHSKAIRLWNTATGKLQSTLNWKPGTFIHALKFSPKGRFLASGHRDGVKLWDNISSRKDQQTDVIGNYQHTLELHGHKDYVYKLAFSPDEKTLFTISKDGTIQAWDTTTGKHRFTITKHLEGIKELVFSQKEGILTSLNKPFNPPAIVQRHRWNTNTGQLLSTDYLKGVYNGSRMATSLDGKIVAAHSSGGRCSLWNLTTTPPQVIDQFALEAYPRGGLNVEIAFSVDDKMLATGGEDGLVHVWNLTESKKIRHRFTVKEHKHDIRTLAFSPDGKMLASGSVNKRDSKTITLCLWRVVDGAPLFKSTAHKSWVVAVAFSPDSKILASGGNELYLWDTATSTQLNTSPRGLKARISTMVFSPDGNTLVVGNWDGILELWDVRTGGLLSTHTGHTWWVEVLKFSADGKTLISASFWDGTILIWDWETLKKASNR